MRLALEWSLEARNVAVFWCQSSVHDKDGDWSNGQKDPKSIYQVNLDPECHNDQEDQQVIASEDHSPECHVLKVCLMRIDLRDKVE